jgi:hypothetical protein
MAMITMNFSDESKKPRKVRTPRREHDAYMTPMPLVESIVATIAKKYVPGPARILEPSCGDGEFVNAAHRRWPDATIVGVDIREECRAAIVERMTGPKFLNADFLTIPTEALAVIDLILGNPPYALWERFVDHALRGMKDGATLAFLLRFNMLVGGAEKIAVGDLSTQAWWTEPRANGLSPNRQIVDTLPIFPRPSFTGTGTDATEYMVAIFRKGFDNGGRFDPVRWDKPAAQKRGRKPKAVVNTFSDPPDGKPGFVTTDGNDAGGDLFGGQS